MASDEKNESKPGLEPTGDGPGDKPKEAAGDSAGDDNLANQSRNDQAKSGLKKVRDRIEQAIRRQQ